MKILWQQLFDFNQGTVCNIQYLVPGRVLDDNQEVLPHLQQRREEGKLERVVTFRGLQALSNVSKQLVGRSPPPKVEYDGSGSSSFSQAHASFSFLALAQATCKCK